MKAQNASVTGVAPWMANLPKVRNTFPVITAIARGYDNFDRGVLGRVAADDAGLKSKRRR